jgi:hypothetical protein
MIFSCSTITIGRDLLQFYTVQTLQSLINSTLWSKNESISEYEGFPVASYTPPMDRFCPQIVIYDGICSINTIGRELLHLYIQFGHFNHQSIAIYDPKIWNFYNMEVSQKFLIPLLPMDRFCNLIVIDDGILLYNYYLKRSITFL